MYKSKERLLEWRKQELKKKLWRGAVDLSVFTLISGVMVAIVWGLIK